jgi:intein/homing endonuclease
MAEKMSSNDFNGGIAKGSRVLVKGQSFKNIEDIKVDDLVLTNSGWHPVTAISEHGGQKVVRVIHQDGYLECSASQKIAVLKDHTGTIELKEITTLKGGDILTFIRGHDDTVHVNKLPEFKYDKMLETGYKKSRDIKIPELDEGIAWLLGEIHGDGYVGISCKKVSIACEGNNPEKSQKLQEQLSKFGINVSIEHPTQKKNYYNLTAKSKQLSIYLESWLKKPKTIIRIPYCITHASNAIKLAYLQGVMDADGSIGPKFQQLVATIYEHFAKDIQNLLYSVGIVCRLKRLSLSAIPNAKQQYGISIVNNEDRSRFSECKLGYKKFVQSKNQRCSNTYPSEFFENIYRINLPENWHKYIRTNNKQNIPYSTWNKVFGESNIVPIAFLSIEEIQEKTSTYTIEVSGDHSFICEGVLVQSYSSLSKNY